MEAEKREDIWFDISWADLHCLSLKERPRGVASALPGRHGEGPRTSTATSAAKQL